MSDPRDAAVAFLRKLAKQADKMAEPVGKLTSREDENYLKEAARTVAHIARKIEKQNRP